jgi:type I restriction-modification system DNA methylase subunit
LNQQNLAGFIWSVADLLRGDFKRSEFGRFILPFTLLRRLECVLESTREAVLKRYFYKYQPPRPLDEIDAELKQVEQEIMALLGEVTA